MVSSAPSPFIVYSNHVSNVQMQPGKHSLKGADHTEILNLSFQNVTDPDTKEVAGKFMINGHIFETPSLPVLLQILNGVRDAHDVLPHGSVYNLERGKVVDLVIPPLKIGGPHPFHLHGVSPFKRLIHPF